MSSKSNKEEEYDNNLVSKDTRAIWNGQVVGSGIGIGFREKVNQVVRERWGKRDETVLKGSCSGGVEGCKNVNVNRIIKVWDSIPHLLQQWESIIHDGDESMLTKSTEMSDKLRQDGNEFYKRKDFIKAHKGFTLSLCFAPVGSKEQVLAYSNRSASFMEMGEKESCNSDIDKALEIMDTSDNFVHVNQLQSVRVKLLERKSRCETLHLEKNGKDENENQTQFQFFSLKNPSKIIEAAEDFVQIEDKPGRGRHVTVNRDISPGTLIILEEPYSKVLVKQFRWETDYCHYCFRDISCCPSVSCTTCVFALYCSYNCLLMDSASHDFYECKISNFLHLLELKRLVHLSYRTLIKLGPQHLYEFWKKDNSTKHTNPNTILGFDEEGKYISSSYYPIHCLIYHDQSLREEELGLYATDAILLIQLLDLKPDFFKSIQYNMDDLEEGRNFKIFAASIILLHQQSFPCNAHSLNFINLRSKHPTPEDIIHGSQNDFGAGAFALLSMINHSCDPNVVRITLVNGVNAVVAIKKLSAGEEVLDNYGAHYVLQDQQERAAHLLSYYSFQCNCIACKNKWPKMDILQQMEPRFMCPTCYSQFKLCDYFKKSFHDIVISRNRNWCQKCDVKYNYNILQEDLKKCTDEFHSAYDLLLENKPLECIPSLIKCLEYVESHMCPPCITTNFIQETLKQAYNLIAINYKN